MGPQLSPAGDVRRLLRGSLASPQYRPASKAGQRVLAQFLDDGGGGDDNDSDDKA